MPEAGSAHCATGEAHRPRTMSDCAPGRQPLPLPSELRGISTVWRECLFVH
jgi:hypothetical protein